MIAIPPFPQTYEDKPRLKEWFNEELVPFRTGSDD